MVSWTKAVLNGIKFGIDPKKWLFFFVPDIVLVIAALIFFQNFNWAIFLTDIWQMIWTFLPLIAIFIALQLVKLWFFGALIYQSWKKKLLLNYGRYIYIVLIAIILFAINILIGLTAKIPIAGWLINTILTILFSLIFFFPYQAAIISKLGPISALLQSFKLFTKNPGKIFLIWLIVIVISSVITMVFLIPLAMWLMPILASATFVTVIITILSNITTSFILIAILLIGSSIASAFTIKTVTDFYLQLKSKNN
jgi:hypothetical protein